MEKGKIYILGDIHGAHKALVQCLERSGFDRNLDTLIQLGDVVDGWSGVYECVEELLTIPNLISIKGNHDQWIDEWISTNHHPYDWTQGGESTLKSYCDKFNKSYYKKYDSFNTDLNGYDLPESHRSFFKNQIKYYRDDNNNLFVHGGFNRDYLLSEHIDPSEFWWNRDLFNSAMSYEGGNKKGVFRMKEQLNNIFIGHTSTTYWCDYKKQKITNPIKAANVYNLDTGAGYDGKLTIMDLETKEYFQSDLVRELYIGEVGR
jgi:serine/threonine protein phosphatase 1